MFLTKTKISSQVAQSVVLGYLTDYFGIEEPTAEDTRDAYLYAMGILLFVVIVFIIMGWELPNFAHLSSHHFFFIAFSNTLNLTIFFVSPEKKVWTQLFVFHFHQGLVLLGCVIVIMHGHAFLAAYKTGMHSRITLTAAIYQKVMNSFFTLKSSASFTSSLNYNSLRYCH